MKYNLFGTAVFMLIVAVAVGAFTAIVRAEIDLERAGTHATGSPRAPARPRRPPMRSCRSSA
jgi:hypothetical protein